MNLTSVLFLSLLFASASATPRVSVSEYYARFKNRAAIHRAAIHQQSKLGIDKSGGGKVFYPVEYGADPTGQNDSSDAIMSALADAFKVKSDNVLLPGIRDLGGVEIDLQGGSFKISKPILFPASGGGNVLIHGGSLRASDDFPTDRRLIELWSPSSVKKPSNPFAQIMAQQAQGTFYEDVTMRDIMFDANFRGGGILVIDSVRTRIDNVFIAHFMTDGILVEGGHETFITDSFVGQHITAGGDPGERNFSGTAINLASNDNIVTDVAVFSAAIGVLLRGPANILTGVHCYNKATGFGGVGIYVKLAGLAQTRISNSYMDWTGIIAEDPVQFHVTNGFFLGDGNIVLKSVSGKMHGVNIVDNMFAGNGQGVPIVKLDETVTKFTEVDQVVVDRNNVIKMSLISTVGQMVVSGVGKKWVADFSPLLLFPGRINHVQYSFYTKARASGLKRFTANAITSVSGNTVVVESKQAVDAVVSVSVDQNANPGETSLYV
ncbi:hypothetical protein AMTRI_Chr07g26360 [Amborella trichopoda]|uniref:Pectate lyase superfamily protein domain-containing protein n=2 Tax=Amborella trichopoda TaxID=13333 RepID=W1P0U0_AMBTC|nr:polygalacturonase QRT3 [Amborella trichopoda]ERN00570.1 hypothetical protein AMTR_s00102p00131940 [Amborella trichopoda]|eukprot:XP_020519510.1 polygalacturonase QRT3 [Amborella trichopoda]